MRRPLVFILTLGTLLLSANTVGAAALKPEVIMSGYQQVLSTLATDDADSALEELYELETTYLSGIPSAKLLENFWRLKLRVVRGLLDAESNDLLIPIIVLHHDAYLMYRERRQSILASHSRTMAKELAEILGEQGGGREKQIFAGWVLTSLGSYQQEQRSVSTSAELFHRALDFDAANQAALMGLAVNHEKVGDYGGAIPFLERALRLDGRNHQALLRWALCQARHDSYLVEEAKKELWLLVKVEEAEPWIRSVAYQELARIYLAEDQKEQAYNVLEEALGSLPGDQHLVVQLASLLDEDLQRTAALAVLASVDVGSWSHGSPRLIYDTWPTAGIEEARETMRSMRDIYRNNLATALLFAQTEMADE